MRMLNTDTEQIFSMGVYIFSCISGVHKGYLLRSSSFPKMEVAPAFNQITSLVILPISCTCLHTES